MYATRARWSDNDRYFGPFTYSRDRRDYRPLAMVLSSGRAEDSDWHDLGQSTCTLRLSAFGHTLIVALPQIVQPQRTKVIAESWDAATVARLGRNWYWDIEKREFGFSCSEGFLQVFRGRHTMDSSTDRSWGYFLPWTQWRHIRHSLYGIDGEHVATIRDRSWMGLTPEQNMERHREEWAILDACPTRAFGFTDFDGEALTAATRIEEREWRFGTGRFKWLSLFRRPKIRRSLDLKFSGETGKRKGSWKGGTIGTGIDMLPDETHEAAFRRYCAEHDMTFLAPILTLDVEQFLKKPH